MVSQFGSLGYTITGRLLNWQLSRIQSLTPFTMRVSHKHSLPKKLAIHKVLYPSMLTECWVEGNSAEEKDAQPTERTATLWGLSSKIDSRIWVNFTRKGLRLGSRHQEPPHTDVSRNLSTVVVRGVFPGLRRRRTGLLPSGPKSSFQMRTSFERIYGVLSRGKWETRDQNMQMSWRPLSKKPGLPAVPQTDHLHATPNWGSN